MNGHLHKTSRMLILCVISPLMLAQGLLAASLPSRAQQAAVKHTNASSDGVPLPADAVTKLLPGSVYFQGRTAPLQLRNAGAVHFGPDATAWVALVDTSGYATDVQEKYQFYLVTEAPLTMGGVKVAAGAYGGGFLGERFLLMDLGGHTVAEGRVESDPAMKRPRPLQLLPDTTDAVKLYLGRHWVQLKSSPGQAR